MAGATWSEFFRDLGMRFLVAAAVVLVIAALVGLMRLLG
jgi:heme exporter protein D